LKFDRGDVPANVSENVYRIMQEALTNVAKHAGATEVSVSLQVNQHRIALAVRDNGAGFTPAAVEGNRLGLLGMRERAELLNGVFTVKSEPKKGAEVSVGLPLD
jgi:signal transduction histidine kinase